MGKRSRQIASRQAAVGRERKRKKRAQTADRHVGPFDAPSQPTSASVVNTVKSTDIPKKRQPTFAGHQSQVALQRQYITADLKQIALFAGIVIILIIVLAFII
jgi:hypothetical protein